MRTVMLMVGAAAILILLGNTVINIGDGNQVNTGTIVGGNCTQGNGRQGEEVRQLEPFTKIRVDDVLSVNVTCGSDPMTRVVADENLLSKIRTTVQGDTLHLSTTGSICTSNPMEVFVQLEEFAGLISEGTSELIIDCNSFAAESRIELRGTSTASLAGSAESISLLVEDTAELDGSGFIGQEVQLVTRGTATVKIGVGKRLEAVAEDTSSIYYLGSPDDLRLDVRDIAEVTPAEP